MSLTGITSKITGIADNGLNTAAEMRSLLTDMSLEYMPYTGATGNLVSDYLLFSNVTNASISGATSKVLVTKEYLGLTVSGTTNTLSKFNSTGNGITDSNIIDNGTTVTFSTYGSGTISGTTAYNLAVDSSGNIIESAPLVGFTESGTPAGGDYIGTWGDYNDVGNSTKIIVDDALSTISLGNLDFILDSYYGTAFSTTNTYNGSKLEYNIDGQGEFAITDSAITLKNAGLERHIYMDSDNITMFNDTAETQSAIIQVSPTLSSHVNVLLPTASGTLALAKDIKNAATTSYNLVIEDANRVITMNNAGANTLTIPDNASVAFTIGTEIVLINKGVGTTTISITSDVLNQNVGGLTMAQYDKRTLIKIAATEWVLGY